MRKLSGMALIVVAALALLLSAPKAFADGGWKVGYLSCRVASGWGLVFGSSRDLDCTYSPTSGKGEEHYKGTINKFGADIGYLRSGVILWTVVAPTQTITQGALMGHYAGATASASLGIGAGAHVLIGGMESSIALQPLSIEGNSGLNVAAGIENVNLDYIPEKK
jgi:hypothetical protein